MALAGQLLVTSRAPAAALAHRGHLCRHHLGLQRCGEPLHLLKPEPEVSKAGRLVTLDPGNLSFRRHPRLQLRDQPHPPHQSRHRPRSPRPRARSLPERRLGNPAPTGLHALYRQAYGQDPSEIPFTPEVRERLDEGITDGWAPDASRAYGAVRWYHRPSTGANRALAELYEPIIRTYLE